SLPQLFAPRNRSGSHARISQPTERRESPLGSIRNCSWRGRANLSFHAAANYQGVPGLTVGGGVFSGKAGQGPPTSRPNACVTLWEGHARWQTGPLDLQALYARGAITDTEALNLTFVGDPTPVPKTFWGGDYALTPFARYERFTPRLRMHRCPKGSVCRRRRPTVWTIGENFNLGPNVVFKIDYQKFKVDSSRDRFDLGMGCAF